MTEKQSQKSLGWKEVNDTTNKRWEVEGSVSWKLGKFRESLSCYSDCFWQRKLDW